MEGVVVSRQIIVGALALTIRPVLKTFEKRLQSASAAFHNQQARNAVRRNSVLSPSLRALNLSESNAPLIAINNLLNFLGNGSDFGKVHVTNALRHNSQQVTLTIWQGDNCRVVIIIFIPANFVLDSSFWS